MKRLNSIFPISASIFISFLFIVFSFSGRVTVRAAEKEETVINIVYDDSGSMYSFGKDTWSQAKYALEVFTAMMGENDTVNVFPMQNYQMIGGSSIDPSLYITLSGKQGGQERIDKVEKIAGGGGTPFTAVLSAGDVLKSIDASNKWLIILTDGDFSEADDYILDVLEGYINDGIQIVFISINLQNAFTAYANGQTFITYETNSNQILETITKTAQRIFSLQQITLSENGQNYSFTADIPLSKLIILAQGEDVQIEDLKLNNTSVSEKAENIEVEVLDNHPYKPEPNSVVAPGLEGVVRVYREKDDTRPMEPGEYSFQTNASSVQVFFEPGIDIQAFLYAGSDLGEQNILDIDTLLASDSPLVLKIINPLTGKEIDKDKTKLLQDADISLLVKDSQGNVSEYKDGDKVHLETGKIFLEATATFPSKVRKSTGSKEVSIISPQPLVRFSSNTGYRITVNNLELDIPLEFTLTRVDNTYYSSEELKYLNLQIQNTPGLEWDITLIDEDKGLFEAIPSYTNGGSAALSNEHMDAELVVTNATGQQYTFKTDLEIDKNVPVELKMEIELPKPEVTGGKQNYMFDPNVRGVIPNAPHIDIKVMAVNPDGTNRPLTDEEWEKGTSGFTYSGIQENPGILDWIYRLLLGQGISFEAVKGDEVSTYKLYLKGSSGKRILPGLINLKIQLLISTQAGFPEVGEADTQISVKPLPLWDYLGTVLIILIITAMVLIYLNAWKNQKKFPKDFNPNYFVKSPHLTVIKGSTTYTRIRPEYNKHTFNKWRPQTASIHLPLTKVGLTGLTLELEAFDIGKFKIKNIDRVANLYPDLKIGHRLASEWKDKNQPCLLSAKSKLEFVGKYDNVFTVNFVRTKRN